MSVAGETIDYGPCAFMDAYHPATVFSSIDHGGRYAYANQPRIAHWNLTRLAQSLLPLLGDDETSAITAGQAAIDAFPALFDAAWQAGLGRKLGLGVLRDSDAALAQALLESMAENKADFTLTFRGLCDAAERGTEADDDIRKLFAEPAAFDRWEAAWRARLALENRSGEERAASMRAVNPAFIPRNHRVEAALAAAEQRADYSLFDALMAVLSRPFDDQPEFASYADPPTPEEVVRETFCGT
jgi:uncharacterized protein YdiU (UPF0061 family)